MATRKVLSLTIEFELSDRKTHTERLRAAHEKGFEAATEAVKAELLEGSVDKVTSHMTWSYRYLDETRVQGCEGLEAEDVDPQGTEDAA